MFLVFSKCNEEIRGDKVSLSTFIYGKCEICGENTGKKIKYSEKEVIKKPEKARIVVTNMRYWNNFLQKKDENGTVFLHEVPLEKLKPNVKKILHLVKNPKSVECLYAKETRKGIVFVHGVHHEDFCPATKNTRVLRRK
jgi:hypothetical protein